MDKAVIKQIVEGQIARVSGMRIEHTAQRLKEDLSLDSLSIVAVIVGIEEQAGIVFDDGDLDPQNLLTVQSLLDLTEKSL